MKKRHSEEQIIRILREAEKNDVPIREVCRQYSITEQTLYRWRNKYGGMEVAEARRLQELESENAKLKRMVAEQMLVIDGLKEFSRKK
jgi:putative transposase